MRFDAWFFVKSKTTLKHENLLPFSLFFSCTPFLEQTGHAHAGPSSILVVLTNLWSFMVMMASMNIIFGFL